jgi:hypothetical protein
VVNWGYGWRHAALNRQNRFRRYSDKAPHPKGRQFAARHQIANMCSRVVPPSSQLIGRERFRLKLILAGGGLMAAPAAS